ncbi:lycopene cyclase domain-containing protein [Micrococcus lacusdianchii]|uniref:lycopene cyclase domain-containing protein n=1 Tax=Micrococcus lacusdianchii TaxID=2915940 RepID=UPI002004C359|nr:lycopene cyclase domain-containing protein [Micrococcus sp. JXJ CY 30]
MYLAALLLVSGCFLLIDVRWRLVLFSGAPRRAAAVLAAGVAFFLAWDLVGIAADVFRHGANDVSVGVFLAPELPVEEVVFLWLLCHQTLVYVEAAPRVLARARRPRDGVGS